MRKRDLIRKLEGYRLDAEKSYRSREKWGDDGDAGWWRELHETLDEVIRRMR